jgi:hypothetical protein
MLFFQFIVLPHNYLLRNCYLQHLVHLLRRAEDELAALLLMVPTIIARPPLFLHPNLPVFSNRGT